MSILLRREHSLMEALILLSFVLIQVVSVKYHLTVLNAYEKIYSRNTY